jgi:enamine deaminase RidA (YjgF/YER057c/UK114 family)
MQIERHNDRGFLSDVVTYGDLLWISGTVSQPKLITIEEQTRDVLREIARRLEAAGSSRADLLSVNVWLVRIEDWSTFNAIWLEWLAGTPAPARAVVESRLMSPYLIEIAATARRTA